MQMLDVPLDKKGANGYHIRQSDGRITGHFIKIFSQITFYRDYLAEKYVKSHFFLILRYSVDLWPFCRSQLLRRPLCRSDLPWRVHRHLRCAPSRGVGPLLAHQSLLGTRNAHWALSLIGGDRFPIISFITDRAQMIIDRWRWLLTNAEFSSPPKHSFLFTDNCAVTPFICCLFACCTPFLRTSSFILLTSWTTQRHRELGCEPKIEFCWI